MKWMVFLVLAVFFGTHGAKSVVAAVPPGEYSCQACGCNCQPSTATCANDTPACSMSISCGNINGSCEVVADPNDAATVPPINAVLTTDYPCVNMPVPGETGTRCVPVYRSGTDGYTLRLTQNGAPLQFGGGGWQRLDVVRAGSITTNFLMSPWEDCDLQWIISGADGVARVGPGVASQCPEGLYKFKVAPATLKRNWSNPIYVKVLASNAAIPGTPLPTFTPRPSAPLVISLARDPYVAGSGTTALTIGSTEGYWIDTGMAAWAGANASNFEISNEKIGVGTSTYPFRSDATYVDGRIRVGPFTGADAYVPRILKLRINGEAGMQWSNPVYLTRLDPNARLPLIFEYPGEGQTLDLEGDYLFRVNDTVGASEYEWKMQQGTVEVSEIRTGSTGPKNRFSISAGSPKHALFREGEASVSVRKKVMGEWGLWTLRKIRLISRYFANCQVEPACFRTIPACRLPQPAEGWCQAIAYRTSSVELLAKNINIRIGDEIYNPGYGERLEIHSNPPNGSANPMLTTLEVTWWQYDKEMRMYMYFAFDLTERTWRLSGLRTYDGEVKGDWLYYDLIDKNLVTAENARYTNPGIRFYSFNNKFASLDIEGMDLKLDWTTNMSIPACSCPAGVPAKSSGNANCDGSIDQADFNLWKSERFNPDGTPRTVPFTPPGPGSSGRQSDFNCDNKIDNVDFETWLTSYRAR